jgi:nitrate/TMAO reductase-like tetraheme cytochrome c subunit
MESEPGKAPKGRPKRGFWSVIQWIFLWGTIFGLTGVALVAMTNKAVIWSSSDSFCGTFCHTMTWTSAAYHQGPHFINASGVRASCGQCHIPYDSSHATATEYVKLLLYKADRGAKDFWNESRKTIATKEEWEKQRPRLRTEFESYTKAHNYITCRGCHSLEAFGGPRSRMKALIHKDLIKANTFDCFQCHQDVGHVYEQPVAKVGGWYTDEQAASGATLYQAQCANCHGAKLEGGAGPSLKGDYVAPDVWRRETIDGMGRNHRPDGPVCGHDLHNPAVAGYCVVPAATKWAALGEPAACGHARIVGRIAGEIEAVRTKGLTAYEAVSRQTKPNTSHLCFRGVCDSFRR